MKKYMLLLIFFPILVHAQSNTTHKPDRSLIMSVELGGATINSKVFEFAALIGFKDNTECSTLEIGYVYKKILGKDIGHNSIYHGLRAAIETPLYGPLGVYGTYDVIKGERWLYDDVFGNGLKVHPRVHGEGTLGIFFAPEVSLLKFYIGLEPHHYDPLKVKKGLTPHKSSSVNIKIKYTIDL